MFTQFYTFLHPLYLCSKCVKFVLSSKIEDYTWADGDALRVKYDSKNFDSLIVDLLYLEDG